MKKTMLLFVFATSLVVAAGSSINAEYYYCRLGQMPLTICDSVVSVRFDAGVPGTHIDQFAFLMECLDEDYATEQGNRDFWIYHIEPGWSLDSALNILRTQPLVEFALPAFNDSCGNLFKLSDLFVISFHDTVSQAIIDSLYDFYHVVEIEGPLEVTGSRRITITPQSPGHTLNIANLFYESGLVKYSQPAMIAPQKHDYTPDDQFFMHQYYFNNSLYPEIDIDVKRAWEITQGHEQTVVAIIDCGFIRNHEDLDSGKVLWEWGRDYVGENAYTPVEDIDPSPEELSGHGVACQGIITAKVNNGLGISGIAPQCKIIPIKIFDRNEIGSSDNTIPEKAINRALSYYRFYKYVPMVISCSWGYGPGVYLDNIAAIIDEAVGLGVPIVFSSGNAGESFYIGESMCFPASLPTTIGIGAIERNGDHWLYSSSGPGIDAVAPSGHASLIYGDVYTTDQVGVRGYNPSFRSCDSTSEDYMCFFGGTSAAAPQVAGILALVRSCRPDLKTFDTFKKIIDSSAIDGIGNWFDTPGFDYAYGYGLASAYRALLAIARGDVNADGTLDILDCVYLIDYKFKQGVEPVPEESMGDVDCDGSITVLDCLFLVNHVLKGGPAPQICFNYDLLE